MSETATLTVVRRAAHPNRVRAYRIMLDGKQIGVVKNGQSASVAVPAARHALLVKVDWVRSAPLELSCAPGATVCVHCETSADPLEILKASVGRPSTHLTLTLADSASAPIARDAEPTQPITGRAKRAAIWFASVMLLGFAFALLVDSGSAPDGLRARLQELVGQVSGFIAVLGAVWIFVRRPKRD